MFLSNLVSQQRPQIELSKGLSWDLAQYLLKDFKIAVLINIKSICEQLDYFSPKLWTLSKVKESLLIYFVAIKQSFDLVFRVQYIQVLELLKDSLLSHQGLLN